MGVRKVYMTKLKFELDTVGRHYVKGRLTMPPVGSEHVSMTDIERLADVDNMSIAIGDFNWVSTQAM